MSTYGYSEMRLSGACVATERKEGVCGKGPKFQRIHYAIIEHDPAVKDVVYCQANYTAILHIYPKRLLSGGV